MIQVERVGVEVWLKMEGLGYKVKFEGDCEVYLWCFNEEIMVQVKVLVGVDGLQLQVGKWVGM